MNPWLSGLGAGLQSFGSSAMQILAQEQARKQREEERNQQITQQKAMLERQQRQADEAFALKAFDLGLSPYEQVEAPIKQMEQLGAMKDMPGPFGMAGDALSLMAQQSRDRLAKGRTFDRTDASGKTVRYYQPYERTKEGMEEAERTRGMRALRGAGYTDSEATAIMSSPEKLQSAILERIRPQPKGQPQEIVQPDGTVTYVQPPTLRPGEAWSPGLKQRTPPAPGSTPYNWQVITDPGTGSVYQVDPRTGQVRPTQAPTMPGGQPPAGGGDQFTITSQSRADAAKAKQNLRRAIARARDLVSEYGITVMPGVQQDQLNAAFTNLQLVYKDAAQLGALTGPDMGLIEKALGDPTSITQLFRGGKEGVLTKLNEADMALAGGGQAAGGQGGGGMPGRGGMQLSPTEQAIYNAAKAEGKQDAEIMAYIQKMRGGI